MADGACRRRDDGEDDGDVGYGPPAVADRACRRSFPNSGRLAGNWKTPAVADGARKLFVESHWTQEKIAEEVGKSFSWVCKRLLFGRFLDFCTTVQKFETPRNLTERRFRGYWERTEAAKEEQRFRQVADAMVGNLVWADHPPV